MLTVRVLPLNQMERGLGGAQPNALHLVSPSFNNFLNIIGLANDADVKEIVIYDDVTQFTTMPKWAMAEKIQELSGIPTKFFDDRFVIG